MRRLGHYFSDSFSFSKVVAMSLVSLAIFAGLSNLIGSVAAAAASRDWGSIPQDAIRIRILANSDSAFDQQVKQEVRDRVEDVILSWGKMPEEHDEAYRLIASRLDEIQSEADRVLAEQGAPYGAAAELGKVPFPDKIFAGETYAAGEYEALRISLGGGEGANWWCVLFPPLCITAATAEEPETETAAAAAPQSPEKLSADGDKAANDAAGPNGDEQPKPRFFLWEMLKKLGRALHAMFS